MKELIKKLAYTVSWLFLIGGIIMTVLFTIWSAWPYKPVEFKNVPFPVSPTTVKSGDTLTYTVDYCKFNNITPTSSKTFVNSIIYNVPSIVILSKQSGCAKINVGVEIPPTLPPDTYVLKITYHYRVNPIRIIDVPVETQRFTVTK